MENDSSTGIRPPAPFKTWQRTLLTLLACVGTTLIATPLIGRLDLANIVMLFLLTMLLVAITLGRGAAVLASVLSVRLFDIVSLTSWLTSAAMPLATQQAVSSRRTSAPLPVQPNGHPSNRQGRLRVAYF